ncbi:MAG: hypothetical protein JSW00_01575 [Thermoplasmata archaeon]|nr:MAG: hypothetical protein JSW00_01575 [Thermoplasmata archaeon]
MKEMPTKINDELNRKKIIIIALLLVVIIVLGCLSYVFSHHYEINIKRKYSNDGEKEAIKITEELDLATILNTSRYQYDSRPIDSPSTEPTAYVWPRVFDKEALDFYKNKIEKLKNDPLISVRVNLNYKVEAKEYSEISITYYNHSYSVYINEDIYLIDISEDPSDVVFYKCAIFINNSLEIITINTTFAQMNLSNVYLIVQNFEYEETYGPLAAYGGRVKQTIVLDQNYLPKIILSRSSGWIS